MGFISIQSEENEGDVLRDILTERQIEVLRQAVMLSYYSEERGIKIKD